MNIVLYGSICGLTRVDSGKGLPSMDQEIVGVGSPLTLISSFIVCPLLTVNGFKFVRSILGATEIQSARKYS